MKDLARNGYTHEEVLAALKMETGTREVRFRYDLLNEHEIKIGELEEVQDSTISMSAFSEIKRTANFNLREEIETTEEIVETTLADFKDKTLGEL